VELLKGVIEWLQRRHELEQTRMEQSVRALQAAAIQTKSIRGGIAQRHRRDAAHEGKLAALWSHAAATSFRLNRDPAERLELKAEYWNDPDAWSPEQIVAAQISLQRITDLTRQLLREG